MAELLSSVMEFLSARKDMTDVYPCSPSGVTVVCKGKFVSWS